MWGEGYDFSPLYTPSSGNIVGALPVGIQTDENKDLPFWPSSACYNYKETWSNPAVRWLWLMEDVAFPAKVEIMSDALKDLHVRFIEKNTGESRDIIVDAGARQSAIEMPEGNYTFQCDGKEKDLSLLPGRKYVIDSQVSFSYSVSYKAISQNAIRITITAEGKGNVQFELRGWNLKMAKKIQNTGIHDEKPVNLVWDASVIDSGKPWIAVVIPDGRVAEMKEMNNIRMGK